MDDVSKEIEEIQTIEPETGDDDEGDNIEVGPVFQWCRREKIFGKMTNFEEPFIVDLRRRLETFWTQHRRRGPSQKLSITDSLIVFLIWAKSGTDFDSLAHSLKMRKNTLINSIDRIRPILLQTLQHTWMEDRIRPTPLDSLNSL